MEKPCKLKNKVKSREADWMEGFVTDPQCVTHNRRRALMFPFDNQCHLSNLIFLKCVKEQMMNSIEHHYSLQYNNTHTRFIVANTPAGIKASTDGLPTESRQKEMVEKNTFLAVSGHQQLVVRELVSQTALLLYEKLICRF